MSPATATGGTSAAVSPGGRPGPHRAGASSTTDATDDGESSGSTPASTAPSSTAFAATDDASASGSGPAGPAAGRTANVTGRSTGRRFRSRHFAAAAARHSRLAAARADQCAWCREFAGGAAPSSEISMRITPGS